MKNWFNKEKETPVLSPLKGYNLWASTYSTESNPIKNFSNKLVEQLLPDLNGKSILDAGCGTGHFCELAHSKDASRIVGIDISLAMIEQARKNCPSSEFLCGDLSTATLEKKSFDVVVCALVLGHIEDILPALKNLSHCLKNGGEMIISDFHPFLTLHHSKRTFVNPKTGNSFEIKHYLHLFQEVINSLKNYGLLVHQLEEPLWNNVPVIYALKAKKIQ